MGRSMANKYISKDGLMIFIDKKDNILLKTVF